MKLKTTTRHKEIMQVLTRLAKLSIAIELAKSSGAKADTRLLTRKYKQARQAYGYLLASLN